MLQRNKTGYTHNVMAHPSEEHPDGQPSEVAPEATVDHPTLLAGFVPVETPKPAASKKTASAVPAPTEGDETP